MPYKRKHKTGKKITKAITKEINRIVHKDDELKYYDADQLGSSLYNLGLSYNVSQVPQGANQSQRVSDEIRCSSLDLKMVFDLASSVSSSLRIVVFKWLQNTFSVAGGTGIMKAGNISTALATCNEYEKAYVENRTILWDSGVIVPKNSSNGSVSINKRINLRNHKIRYIAGATTGTGQLYVMAFTDTALVNAASWSFTSRLNYTDA